MQNKITGSRLKANPVVYIPKEKDDSIGSSEPWNNVAGGGITGLTGDVTATGPGVVNATVNKTSANALVDVANNTACTFKDTGGTSRRAILWDGADAVCFGDLDRTHTGFMVFTGTTASPALLYDKAGNQYAFYHSGNAPGSLVYDSGALGAATASWTTNGSITLDGVAHGGYWFESVIENASGATRMYSIYVEGDTTAANYESQRVGSASQNNAYLLFDAMSTGTRVFISGRIDISPSGYFSYIGTAQRVGDNANDAHSVYKTATIANITRIDVVASGANGIGINSRFRLWRRK